MTPARTKKKTVKKKPPTRKKPAPKKKAPVVKKSAKAAVAEKKKAAKPDAKKAAAGKAAAPSARDLAAEAAARLGAQEGRAKKAPKVRPSRVREPGKRPDLPIPTAIERPTGAPGALGEKFVCYSCGAKFYDLGKPEPRCPKCGADQREAPRQTRVRPAIVPENEPVERPVKRSRLLDDDDDEIAIEPDADTEVDTDDDLDLGLGVVDDGEDFGPDEPEEEEPEEEP